MGVRIRLPGGKSCTARQAAALALLVHLENTNRLEERLHQDSGFEMTDKQHEAFMAQAQALIQPLYKRLRKITNQILK